CSPSNFHTVARQIARRRPYSSSLLSFDIEFSSLCDTETPRLPALCSTKAVTAIEAMTTTAEIITHSIVTSPRVSRAKPQSFRIVRCTLT
ncbi:MAG TPA: hypothetical protein VGO52_12485, partial [Hyphomonadaceae bacterium]|nr:hypothetical protein [Hyphomonadaceae bacterium]